jgi:hypothetical protein
VLKVGGKIIGEFDKPDRAYISYDFMPGFLCAKLRPIGTTFMVR